MCCLLNPRICSSSESMWQEISFSFVFLPTSPLLALAPLPMFLSRLRWNLFSLNVIFLLLLSFLPLRVTQPLFFWLFRSSESAKCAGRRVAPSWSPLDTFYTSNEGKKMKIYIIISPVFLFLSDKKFLFNFFTSAISLKGHWKSEIEVWGKLSAKCV